MLTGPAGIRIPATLHRQLHESPTSHYKHLSYISAVPQYAFAEFPIHDVLSYPVSISWLLQLLTEGLGGYARQSWNAMKEDPF